MAEVLYKNGSTEIRLDEFHSINNKGLAFFHTSEFINRRKESTPLFFNLYEAGKPLTSIAFEIVDHQAISLPKSPFGGIITNQGVDQQQLERYLKTIIDYFQKNKVRTIQIKNPPDCYTSSQRTIDNALLNAGFSISHTDINQHVTVDQTSLRQKVSSNRTKQLDLCDHHQYEFKKLNSSYLGQAYDLITECLEAKRFPITMTKVEIKNAFLAFPAHYILFGIFDKSDMIATAISVKVNNKILYNFYHGDRLAYRKTSPVAMLLIGIYAYCQQQQFDIFDLGISTDQGVLNEGLFNFKKSCNAVTSKKISYFLNLDS